jgi:amidophosphoribosyltransferase
VRIHRHLRRSTRSTRACSRSSTAARTPPGITTFTDKFHVKKGLGLVRDVFDERTWRGCAATWASATCATPPWAAARTTDVQPFHIDFPVGIAMAHNGNVTNFLELKERLALKGVRLGSSTATSR